MLAHDRRHLGGGVARLVDRQRGVEGGYGSHVLEGPAQEGVGRTGPRCGDGQRQGVDVDAELALQHQREQGLLALGVGVEKTRGDAGAFCDIRHAGAPVSAGKKDAQGSLDDVVQTTRRTRARHAENYK